MEWTVAMDMNLPGGLRMSFEDGCDTCVIRQIYREQVEMVLANHERSLQDIERSLTRANHPETTRPQKAR